MKKTATECDHCGGQDPASSCGRCGGAKYCSKECQRAHWKGGHNLVCVSPEKRQPAPLPKEEGDECAICLHPFQTNTICTLMCDHSFHVDCLKKMIGKGGSTCPLCRAALPPAEISFEKQTFKENKSLVRLCRLANQLNPSKVTCMVLIDEHKTIASKKPLLVEAINYFPEDFIFRRLLAECHMIDLEFSSAVDQYDQIVFMCKSWLRNPDSAIESKCKNYELVDIDSLLNAYYNLADNLYRAGNYSRSMKYIDNLIEKHSDIKLERDSVFLPTCLKKQKGYDVSDAYNVRGCLLAQMNDPRAQVDFKRAIRLNPKNMDARCNWAKWLMPHDPRRGFQMFRKIGMYPHEYLDYGTRHMPYKSSYLVRQSDCEKS
jgi:tetratricopeptide (TPR) repeat protein